MSNKSTNEELLIRIKNGDEVAKSIFVEQNIPLVHSIVKRFHRGTANYDELYQIGCVGLMKAINNFDLKYHVQFSTYAVPIIMGEIKRYFRDDGNMRISRSLKEGYLVMIQKKEELSQQYHREPTYQEIAGALNIDVSDVILAFEAHQFVYSLDETIYENDGAPIVLQDKVKDKEDDVTMKISLEQEIKHLEQREQLILYYRYQLGMTQGEIAKKLQISQVQVSRLEKKILHNLKQKFTVG